MRPSRITINSPGLFIQLVDAAHQSTGWSEQNKPTRDEIIAFFVAAKQALTRFPLDLETEVAAFNHLGKIVCDAIDEYCDGDHPQLSY